MDGIPRHTLHSVKQGLVRSLVGLKPPDRASLHDILSGAQNGLATAVCPAKPDASMPARAALVVPLASASESVGGERLLAQHRLAKGDDLLREVSGVGVAPSLPTATRATKKPSRRASHGQTSWLGMARLP